MSAASGPNKPKMLIAISSPGNFGKAMWTSAFELWEWYKGAELRAVQSVHHPLKGLEISSPPDAHDAPPLPEPTVVAVQMSSLREETIIAYAAFPEGIAVWSYDDRGRFAMGCATAA